MSAFAIVTDTDSSIPSDLAREMNIHQVPITVHFGADSFESGVDIDDEALFERVNREGKLPTTSAPSPGKFLEAFQLALEQGANSILCICVSSEVSATYSSAVQAAEMLQGERVKVMDSRSLSLGQGFMVLAAAEVFRAGGSFEEALHAATITGHGSQLFASLATLRYLAMSGRVGHIAAGFADLIDVKPILTIRNGQLELLERVRMESKAWNRVIELCDQSLNGKIPQRVGIVHVDAFEKAQKLESLLRESIEIPEEILYAELTPGLSVHSGMGMVGVAFVA
jgi:DegV family protein with EDD domain